MGSRIFTEADVDFFTEENRKGEPELRVHVHLGGGVRANIPAAGVFKKDGVYLVTNKKVLTKIRKAETIARKKSGKSRRACVKRRTIR